MTEANRVGCDVEGYDVEPDVGMDSPRGDPAHRSVSLRARRGQLDRGTSRRRRQVLPDALPDLRRRGRTGEVVPLDQDAAMRTVRWARRPVPRLPSGKGCAPPDERADICVRGTQRGGGCGTTGNLQIVWREAPCSRTCAPGELRQHSANDITSTRFAVVEGGEVAFRGTGSYRNCLASNSISMPSTPGK